MCVDVCKMFFLLLVRFLQRLLGHQVCQAGPHSFADTSAMWWRCPSLSESAQGHVSAQASPPGWDLGTSTLTGQSQKEAFPLISRKMVASKARGLPTILHEESPHRSRHFLSAMRKVRGNPKMTFLSSSRQGI